MYSNSDWTKINLPTHILQKENSKAYIIVSIFKANVSKNIS